ncbi:MAG: Ldh family oxidoreductase [Castellaniella sp.]|uniref:Ldh family oxidoreductase n=1 Tax=Castellaniella sp. TaxID=1955812 RepID=UPI003C722CD3
MTDMLYLSPEEIEALSMRVLQKHGLGVDHAAAITEVVLAGQRDDCQSHGVYRILSCVQTIRKGKVNLAARPVLQDGAGAIVRVDADMGFSPLAFQLGVDPLADRARRYGLGALVIQRCVHFSALWPEIEALTDRELVALALTPSHAWVAPAGGRRPTLGTNPIAFGWPRDGKDPYVFDFATSAIARGDLELHRRSGQPLPAGCGVDAQGRPTTDPLDVMAGAMLTFGGHKGSALSTMVELMAGALIGDWLSSESLDYDEGAGASPCHGELILAFDPAMFGDPLQASARAESLFEAIESQGARLPSQRRYAARARSREQGIAVPRAMYQDILALASEA